MELKNPENQQDEPSALRKIINVVAYPVSLVTGYHFFNIAIRRSAYDITKNHDAFTDINIPYRERLKDACKTAAEKIRKGESANILEATVEMRAKHKLNVAERMEKLGLGSLSARWKFNRSYERQEALINGVTAAGITLGVLLTVAHSKALAKLFSNAKEVEKSNDGPGI